MPGPGGHHDVVVVGAGLAGLNAATSLVANGASVAVIEARHRVGGRVSSHRFAEGQWCERGAEFVDVHHHEVLGLAARLGLELVPARPPGPPVEDRLLDVAGRVLALAELPNVAADLARWDEARSELAALVDPADPVGGPGAAALDALDVASFVRSLGLSLHARTVVERELRTEYMVPPAELSRLHFAWVEAVNALAGDGREAHRMCGGLDQLATGLAGELGDAVHLGRAAVAIDAERGEVTDSMGDRWTAGTVVVAVPPPVLARIEVTPRVPGELLDVGVGIGAKLSTRYGRRVWLDHGSSGSVLSDRAYGELWETSAGQPGDHGVLTALLSSHDGAALGALPDIDRRVRVEAERIFPGARGLEMDGVTTDWTNDRWSLGCYVAFAPGTAVAAWRVWRAPFGRVRFAGEHTDEFAGYMEGALRSGRRVAAEVLGA